MNTIVSIHSFRRGVGKTSLTVNLAVLLALQGKRVALVDRDFQTPSAHLFFGLNEDEITHTYNDYLRNKCDILAAAQEITPKLGPEVAGKLFLLAASTQTAEILYILRNPLDLDRYTKGFQDLVAQLALDVLLIDTPAGVNEDTLPSIAISDTLVVVLHPDKQDFQGTAVIVDVARNLQVPKIRLVLNDAPEVLDVAFAQSQLEQNYQCGKGIILQHSEAFMSLASRHLFVLRYPEHPLSLSLKELVEQL
jgi:MinD-like ATPase involved in chromosome partitioning or flagellar assembly